MSNRGLKGSLPSLLKMVSVWFKSYLWVLLSHYLRHLICRLVHTCLKIKPPTGRLISYIYYIYICHSNHMDCTFAFHPCVVWPRSHSNDTFTQVLPEGSCLSWKTLCSATPQNSLGFICFKNCEGSVCVQLLCTSKGLLLLVVTVVIVMLELIYD